MRALAFPLSTVLSRGDIGGKAFMLGELIRAGYRVPKGIVVPNLSSEERLRLLPEIVRQVSEVFELNGEKHLAVRSSAAGEDSAAHSFAGQLDSFLNIRTKTELEAAIRNTWNSIDTDRCRSYQTRNNIRLSSMGVVIQEQIDARFSGVLFSKHPSRSEFMLAEYVEGLGDKLMQGEVTPESLLFRREDGKPIALPSSLLSVERALSELAGSALRLENELGYGVDLEWAIDGSGTLFLLQVRPITVEAQTVPVELWSNANIAENYSEPVCPLLYSIARQGYTAYFRNLAIGFGFSTRRVEAMRWAFDRIVGAHEGRLYYNLSSIHRLLAHAPQGRRLCAYFNDFIGTDEGAAISEPMRGYGFFDLLVEAVRIPVSVVRQYLFVPSRVMEFERTVRRFCDVTHPGSLDEKPLSEFHRWILDFLDIRLRRWNNAALADTATMVCSGAVRSMLPRRADGSHDDILYGDLNRGLASLASNIPVLKLWELSREVRNEPDLRNIFENLEPAAVLKKLHDTRWAEFYRKFLWYLDEWGFRSSGELLLVEESSWENPLPTISLLQKYIERDGPSPADLIKEQSQERHRSTAALLARVGWRRFPLKLALRLLHSSIRLRERARLQQARLYVRLRQILLAAGKTLERRGDLCAREDIFFLSLEELTDQLSGLALHRWDRTKVIQERRAEHERFRKLRPPDIIELGFGERYLMMEECASDSSTTARSLRGIGASAGRACAEARVLKKASEGAQLQQGEILVTGQTDPGWATIFPLVSGLVIERGGMLAHGAIVAREYGIPAVIGAENATAIISNGMRIQIDGSRGTVEIEDEREF